MAANRLQKKIRYLILLVLLITGAIYLTQARWFWRFFYPWPYRQEIQAVAVNNGLDPFLLAALIRVESRFNPGARSEAGAVGMMQIMPETAVWVAREIGVRDFTPEDLYKPEINLQIGAWYLAHLFREFNGNRIAGLAAYNAGRGNVENWLTTGQWQGTVHDLDKIPFRETRVYLKGIVRDYQVYKYLYGDRN